MVKKRNKKKIQTVIQINLLLHVVEYREIKTNQICTLMENYLLAFYNKYLLEIAITYIVYSCSKL